MTINPFWRLHYHINGGWRRLVAMVVIYAALLTGGWYMGYRISLASFAAQNPGAVAVTVAQKSLLAAGVSRNMMWWVGGSQALFLLILAPAAIRKAVLTDYQSGMIESHRLTPLTGLRVVLGYVTAAPMQALVLYAASVLIGAYFAADMARSLTLSPVQAVQTWLGGQILLVSIGFLIASVSALFSLHSQGKMGKAFFPFIMIGAMFGGGTLLRLVPGVGLIAGYLAGQVIFSALTTGGMGGAFSSFGPVAAWSVAAQLACSLLFIAAASRKVRQPDGALFGLPLGLLFMLIVGAGSVAGIVYAGVDTTLAATVEEASAIQLGATLVLLMLLGYYPLSAAAHEQVAAERAAQFGEHKSPQRRFYVAIIPLLLTMVLLLVSAASLYLLDLSESWFAAFRRRSGNGAVFAAFFLQYLMDFAIIAMLAGRGKKVFAAILIVFIALRVLPLVLDMVPSVTAAMAADEEPVLQDATSFFSHASPLGTLLVSFTSERGAWIGVAIQAGLTLAALALWRRSSRRVIARRAATTAIRATAL